MFTKIKKYFIKKLNLFSRTQWSLFYIALGILCISALSLVYTLTKKSLVEVPRSGGTYTEGMIGVPRFINPVLAFTDTDKDLTHLVFAGLFKRDANGIIVPVLAEKYTTTEDELTYTVTLKKEATFHNKEKVTAEDVVFTIKKIQNPVIKSPKENTWKGVEVTALDEYTIEFKLKQRFGDFLDMLTVGILPQKEWLQVTDEEFNLSPKNIAPVGAGPYSFDTKNTTKENIPTSITFTTFKKYALGKPFIDKLIFRFYDNEKKAIVALNTNEVDRVNNISPENVSLLGKNLAINKNELPRSFGLFLNSTEQPLFRDQKIVSAINMSINKKSLVEKILLGYGKELDSLIPFAETIATTYDPEKAAAILEKDGYEKDPDDGLWKKKEKSIVFTITTGDIPELKDSAEFIKQDLRNFGIDTTIQTFDTGSLTQNVLNSRKYEALVFGQIVNTPSNLFAFWHSSERNAPGLNITMYANSTVDGALEKLRKETDEVTRQKLIEVIDAEIQNDMPVIPLFKPVSIEAERNTIYNKKNTPLSTHRFSNIEQWSLRKDYVWNIFKK